VTLRLAFFSLDVLRAFSVPWRVVHRSERLSS